MFERMAVFAERLEVRDLMSATVRSELLVMAGDVKGSALFATVACSLKDGIAVNFVHGALQFFQGHLLRPPTDDGNLILAGKGRDLVEGLGC